MHLLHILLHKAEAPPTRIGLAEGARAVIAGRKVKMLAQQRQKPVRPEAARAGDHDILRHIMRPAVGKKLVPRNGADALPCAENGQRQRIAVEKKRVARLGGNILRAVLGHENLFEDNAALLLQLLRIEGAVEYDIGQHVHGNGQVLVQNLGIVAGTFL